MSHIFISHVEEDAEIAREIADSLEAAGYSTWYYQRDTVPGASYLIQVTQAIDQCKAVVLLVSSNSISSSQVTKEVVHAFEKDKPFFPVLHGITHIEFQERQPEWRHALGSSASVNIGPEGAPACTSRLIDGLMTLDIHPATEQPCIATAQTIPADYTPRHLAERIIAARPSIEGERKQVTVLLADVTGFTSPSGRLDPEEAQDLTRQCLNFMTEEIQRYEGTTAQYTGYGVMALFGAPVAHEDAPQRALYAALGIQEQLKSYSEQLKERNIEFEYRIGADTGLVIVGKISDDLTMEYSPIGDTIDLASEMKNLSERGAIQVTESTYRLTEGYFDFQSLGDVDVRGKEEPVKAYRVLGLGPARTRLAASLVRGLTPFVGRRRELEHLADCFDRVKDVQGQVVGIVGEPGMGKSRLVLEFTQTLPAAEYTYIEGGCLHYGGTIAYQPLLEILRAYFDIREGEQESVVSKKTEDKIDQLDERLKGILLPLHDLLSLKVEDEGYLKLEPQQKRERIFESIRTLLIRESQNKPLILAVEDLHWIDKTSEEFLTYLIGSLGTAHILLILLYRPEYTPVWVSKTYYSQVRIDQLSIHTSTELVQSILEGGEVVPELRELVLNRAAGNPLFMEEFTRTLVENGYIQRKDGQYVLSTTASDIQVPDTVQGIIAARMDRLEENLKRTMQVASVIGRDFTYRVLNTIMGMREELKSYLLDLQGLEFIYEKSLFPELEYIFKHALTQEVAYKSLLLKRRKAIHEKIGKAIEELYPDRLEEFYEALALHFKQGDSLDKAIDYFIRSGEKSLDRYAVAESHQQFKEALDILSNRPSRTKEDDALLIDLLIKWAYVFYYRGDFKGLTDLLNSHKDVAESLDDKAKLGMFYAWLGFALDGEGKVRNADQYLQKALKIGEENADEQVIGYACTWLSWNCAHMGLLDEAIAFGERAQEVSRSLESDQYLYFKSLSGVGTAHYFRGETKKAAEIGEALLEYGKVHANIRSLVQGHIVMGYSHMAAGAFSSAVECFGQAVQVSADPYYAETARLPLSFGYLANGQVQEAEEAAREGLTFSQESGAWMLGRYTQVILGGALMLMGEIGRGLPMVEEALRTAQEDGHKSLHTAGTYLLGKIYAFLEGRVPQANQKATQHLNKAIELAEEIGAKGTLSSAYLDIGLLHKAKGENDKARECISTAVQLCKECELETYLKQANEALESLD